MPDSVLSIDGRKLFSRHRSYYPALMLVFGEEDRNELELESDGDWGLYYETTAAIVRDRLDVLGYSVERARVVFENGLVQLERELAQFEHEYEGDEEFELLREADQYFARELTFEAWQEKIRDYLMTWPPEAVTLPSEPTTISYFDEERAFELAGFPTNEPLACLRAILDMSPGTFRVRYDVSGLVQEGYIETDQELASEARFSVGSTYLPSQKIIVLTEGSFDSQVLGRCIRLLAPHLESYFSFLDFGPMRVQGGAPVMLGFLRAFVGAGVANRIIAILDNDSAGRNAVRGLAGIPLPPRVRVLHYPAIGLLRDYPTIGPTGMVPMDVNGLAGSLEMYLGEDVLRSVDGELMPIQWRGFIDGVEAYQGEVTRKAEIHRRFEAKLARCEEDPAMIRAGDWNGVREILRSLQTAFAL